MPVKLDAGVGAETLQWRPIETVTTIRIISKNDEDLQIQIGRC